MSINSLSTAQLKKQQEVTNFLAYLDAIQAGKYDFRNEEITMLSGFNKDGVAGLSNTEINTIKTRLTNLSNNISTYFNADGTNAQAYDLDNDGNTTNDVQALGYIVNGRTQNNSSVRVANTSEMGGRSSAFNFITKGNYKIAYDGGASTTILDPQNRVISTVSGDPHVNEGSGGYWHFGDDSTFILPDGTKILFDTKNVGGDIFYTQGLVIDDGTKALFAGTVQVGNKTFTSGSTAKDISTLGADTALFSDANLTDKSSATNAGVFVYSEAANNSRSGWAIKTAEGKFEDVKNEAWGDYLAVGGSSFAGQVEGVVKVSREARLAALDGANAGRIQALTNNNASFTLIESSLQQLEAGNTTNVDAYIQLLNSGKASSISNYQKLVDGAYSQATINAYVTAANSPFTNPYDNMLDGGVSKDVIETLATIPGLSDSGKLTYSIIANIRKDLSVAALTSFVGLHKDALAGTTSFDAYQTLNSAISSASVDSADVVDFVAFAGRHKNLDRASYDTYANLLTSNKSALTLNAYDTLITRGASVASRTAFTTLINANASDRVLTAFNKLSTDAQVTSFINVFNNPASSTTKEAWLEEMGDYAAANDNNKLTVLSDLINANYTNSRTFITNTANLNRAVTLHGLANGSSVLPMLLTLNDAGVNDSTKDRLVTLAQAGSSPIKLNAFTVTNSRKQASEITALNTYLSLNAGDDFLQAFTALITGTNNASTAKVGVANSLIGLKETIGARVYPAVETGEVKFNKYADAEMIKSIDTMVNSILNNSSTFASDPDVITRVKSELLKASTAGTSEKNQLIATQVAAAALNSGLAHIDSLISTITRNVDAKYASLVGSSGGGGTTPPPVIIDRVAQRLQSRINSYLARKESYERILASIPADSTNPRDISKRNSYQGRIASMESIIATLQAQLDAHNATATA